MRSHQKRYVVLQKRYVLVLSPRNKANPSTIDKTAVHLAKRYVELVPPEDIYGLVEHARVFASLLLEDAHINTIDVEEVERLSGSEAILALSSRLFKLEKYVGLDTEGSTDESYVSFCFLLISGLSC